MVAHAGGVHGDDLGVAGQFGGEEDDGDEDEQAAEHVHVVGDEGEVVFENDLLQGDLVLKEIIHFLCEVKDHRNRKNEHNREKECAQKFLYYVPIKTLQL